MTSYVIRLRLPDRPGALGAVASRIGSVGGDVVSIDILQRGGRAGEGFVIDEVGVVVPGDNLTELLRTEILEVDGVSVEAMRPVEGPLPDRQAEILETVTTLFQQTTPARVLEYLTSQVRRSHDATFAAAFDPETPGPVAADGDAPSAADLAVLVHGETGSDEYVVTTRLARAGVVLVVKRSDLSFRPRERLRISTMAELADHRWRELASQPLAP
ncbi:MAG: ACT domain-containing protein [Acidimicrobiales bacterium]